MLERTGEETCLVEETFGDDLILGNYASRQEDGETVVNQVLIQFAQKA